VGASTIVQFPIGRLTDPGLRVDSDSPISVATVHRWITTMVQVKRITFAPEAFALFPVVIRPAFVLTYAIQQSGSALSRESTENIAPGDYGIFNEGLKVPFVYKVARRASNDCRWLEFRRLLYPQPYRFICKLGDDY
jgi:hypothetical protein